VGGRVYPPLRRWIKVAERFRGQVLTQMSRQLTGEPRAHYGVLTPEQREAVALFSGKDSAGHPLCGHQHAFFLIWPDANGLPTRLIVWRRQPFTSAEVQALMAAAQRLIAWEDSAPDWALRLVPLPFETPPPSGLLAEARVWQSATPFVPHAGRHHFRRNGRARPNESPEHLLVRLLQLEGRPLPERVTSLEECEEARWIYLHETRQRRRLREESHTPWVRPGYRLRVTFQEPVRGPLILGDSAHFGLGLFMPAEP
jgi:CRISPR-associated protein Csb2